MLLHFLMLLLFAYNVVLATSSTETTLVTMTNMPHFQSHIWNSIWILDQHIDRKIKLEHQVWKRGGVWIWKSFTSKNSKKEKNCMEKLGIYLISLLSIFDPDLFACFMFGEHVIICWSNLLFFQKLIKGVLEVPITCEAGWHVSLVANMCLILDKSLYLLRKRAQFLFHKKPNVDLDKIVWDHLSFEKIVATLHFSIKNHNHFEIGIH